MLGNEKTSSNCTVIKEKKKTLALGEGKHTQILVKKSKKSVS